MKQSHTHYGRQDTMSELGYREKCLSQKINVCNVCGSNGDLLVHHIDGDRNNNQLENLIPVCETCHGKIHASNDKGEKWDKYTEKLPDNSMHTGPGGNAGSGYVVTLRGDPTCRVQMDHQGRLYVPKAVRESLDIEGKSATLELKVAVLETHE
jgi:hypothetical protein